MNTMVEPEELIWVSFSYMTETMLYFFTEKLDIFGGKKSGYKSL